MKTVLPNLLISLALIVLAALGSFQVVNLAMLGVGVVVVALATSVIIVMHVRGSRRSAISSNLGAIPYGTRRLP